VKNINDHLQPLDFIVVGVYLVILVGIGYWVSFVRRKNSGENLFLAGRSLGWMSIGFTMWGTNVGPSMLIASASIGYTTGIVAGNFGWYAFPFILLLALVFAPRYLRAKIQTLPEFMGKRFGESTRGILAWYTLATILISWLALTLFAGGILMGQIFVIPLWLSVVILVLTSAFFTIAGGLEAIAYTNTFQMILLISVSIALTVAGVMKAGGLLAIYEQTPSGYWNLFLPLDDDHYPWLAIVLGYPVMGVWFWCTDQSMVQSVLGARNLKQGQLGASFAGWLKILDVALFILPGMICYILFPNLQDPDQAYMTMVTGLFPVGMTGLVMAVLIAALVSTVDSALNSLSTVFTIDIYVNKYEPEATPRKIVSVGRIVTGVGAITAILLALLIDSIQGLNLFDVFQSVLGFIAPSMSVVFLLGVLWKKMTTLAANIVLSAGTFFSMGTGVLYLWVFPSGEYDFWPHFLILSFIIFVILFIAAIVISLVRIIGTKQAWLPEKNISRTSGNVKVLWLSLTIVMVALYIFFNGH
jgi:SSS family solute:Na+ symporter